MNVHQISFFAFWGALNGLEQDFDLHFTFQLICRCAARPGAWLQRHNQAESAAYQPPHHDAAVHSWHIEEVRRSRRRRRRTWTWRTAGAAAAVGNRRERFIPALGLSGNLVATILLDNTLFPSMKSSRCGF